MATSLGPPKSKAESAIQFATQSEQLSLLPHGQQHEHAGASTAVEAKFITPLDPVVETASGDRLPAIPVQEARKLNQLKDEVEERGAYSDVPVSGGLPQKAGRFEADVHRHEADEQTLHGDAESRNASSGAGASLRNAIPPTRTSPLFPPLPLYGPPTTMRNLHCLSFRISSFFLSLGFLAVIVLGSAFTSIPLMFRHIGLRLQFKNPDARRPFHDEETRRQTNRDEENKNWQRRRKRRRSAAKSGDNNEEDAANSAEFTPTEGGKDPLICDVGYYARRVGLDVEEFKVQTEDGFIIALWHVYNPKEYIPVSAEHRDHRSPEVFKNGFVKDGETNGASGSQYRNGDRRYPVLLVHGLLQSAGAYCTNDDDSLAFFLCKSGYDVWLGNNRCGFKPEHKLLQPNDPRMWAWNIRQMGVLDLPALVSRVLGETGFEKLGLVCHSQGTTETFVALAKEQRPDLGNRISVFCALAPAAYAGPLIGKMYFKFMRAISPGMFRVFFGIHSFIPFMMDMHSLLPGKLYGAMGYRVFSFLFNWTDDRWDQGLRDRMFQFAPVYVSAESMRWWLGRECFAKQKCILSTREENKQEDEEDESEDYLNEDYYVDKNTHSLPSERANAQPENSASSRGRTAWYDEQVPPFALWIAGSDALVDGSRLLRRFERGREPHVRVVHSKVIPEYEHLDVIWAMDMIEQVGKEVREVIWKTASPEAKATCRVPSECDGL